MVGNTKSNNGDVFGNHTISPAYRDIWMFKLNGDGELQWQQCFGGIVNETVEYGVVKKSDNNFVIAGIINYGPSYDVGCTVHSGTHMNRDIWVFEIMMEDSLNAISPPANTREIKVYPNPATTELWLQLPENLVPAQAHIELISPTGRLLYKAQPTGHFHKIETAHLPSGLYMVRLWDGKQWRAAKVVVK